MHEAWTDDEIEYALNHLVRGEHVGLHLGNREYAADFFINRPVVSMDKFAYSLMELRELRAQIAALPPAPDDTPRCDTHLAMSPCTICQENE
jgi:hypothetical protein